METTKKKKEFDPVKNMREARERISAETQGMNAAELKAYVKKHLEERKIEPVGRRLSVEN